MEQWSSKTNEENNVHFFGKIPLCFQFTRWPLRWSDIAFSNTLSHITLCISKGTAQGRMKGTT